jgi:hypothetical protein
MSKYKALALDVDGTLLNTKKEVTDKVLRQIRRLQERKIPIMIASGRPEQGISHVAKAIGMDVYGGYILSFNGGKITEFSSGKVVYNTTVPVELNEEVIKYAHKIPQSTVLTYESDGIITEDTDNQYVQLESRIVRMPAEKVADLRTRVVFPANKFLIPGEPAVLQREVAAMAEHFKGRLNIFQSEPFFIEIVPLGIDKAQSLDYLLSTLGLTGDELVACGDGGNDITMIDYAGMGVAMENACDAVKKVADYVTASCDEDGVAKAIEKFFP